jgi:outer membrane protein
MIWLWTALAASPAVAAEPLSLDQALARGLEVSEDLSLVAASRTRAEGQVWTARAGWLPAVNGSISYQHQFASQYDGVFGPTGGDTVNPFAVKDTWQLGLQVQQGIYGGGRTGAAYKVATLSRDLADQSGTSTRATVVLVVTSAYYDAVLSDRLVAIAQSTLDQAKTTLANAQLESEEEHSSEFDVLRASVEVQNQQVALIQAERNQALAHLQLGNLLDVAPDAVLPTEDLEQPRAIDELVTAMFGAVPAERVAVSQADTAVEISEASKAMARAPGLPSAGLIANMALIGWSENVLPPTGSDAWKDAASVQLLVNVPMFNGGSIRGQIHSASGAVAEAETRADQAREYADADQRDASEALRTAEAQWDATTSTVDQADRAYAIAELRFNEGISTQVELADARLLRQRALANRAQAARDLQVARMRVALLPLLPLQ